MTDEDVPKIGEAINGFEGLYPRQVTYHEYMVLSLRNDSITAHRVDVSELDCDCMDASMNTDDPEVCDHVAVALHEHPKRTTVEEETVWSLSERLSEARDVLQDIERYRTGIEADAHAEATAASEEESDGTAADHDLTDVEKVELWLEDNGIPERDVKVWKDDDYGSIQAEADEMDQDDFDTFRDLMQDSDQWGWDRNNGRNYLPADQIEDVVGS